MPKRHYTRRPIEERFWEYVEKSEGCWIWKKGCNQYGYGRFYLPGHQTGKVVAHRIAWILTFGEIPDGLLVLHRCDVRACVRPDHLFLGTHKDNTADMIQKGRARWAHFQGEQHGSSKLRESEIHEIVKRVKDGESKASVGRSFNVTRSHVCKIVLGQLWKHVDR